MPRIMLVDDDYGVLSSLRRCIHQMPAHSFRSEVVVEIFERPQLALARAAEHEFDLVIADWHMPGMDGLSFMEQLLQLQPGIARLIMSADTRIRAEASTLARLRIFHFISKPWNTQMLRVLLRLALDNRPQEREPFVPRRRPAELRFQQFTPDPPPVSPAITPPFAPEFRIRSARTLNG